MSIIMDVLNKVKQSNREGVFSLGTSAEKGQIGWRENASNAAPSHKILVFIKEHRVKLMFLTIAVVILAGGWDFWAMNKTSAMSAFKKNAIFQSHNAYLPNDSVSLTPWNISTKMFKPGN